VADSRFADVTVFALRNDTGIDGISLSPYGVTAQVDRSVLGRHLASLSVNLVYCRYDARRWHRVRASTSVSLPGAMRKGRQGVKKR
jgi:hypothetical protein